MQDAVPVGEGSMIAVLGMSLKELNSELTDFKTAKAEFVKSPMIMLMDKL